MREREKREKVESLVIGVVGQSEGLAYHTGRPLHRDRDPDPTCSNGISRSEAMASLCGVVSVGQPAHATRARVGGREENQVKGHRVRGAAARPRQCDPPRP